MRIDRRAKAARISIEAAALLLAAGASAPGALSVIGGPTYTPGVGGYLDPYQVASAPNGTYAAYGPYVNNDGVAIGYAQKLDAAVTSLGYRALRWSASSSDELGNLGLDATDSTFCYVRAINSAGLAVGEAKKHDQTIDKGARAVRWAAPGTTATQLGDLGTDNSGYTDSRAYAVNASGTTVGSANKYSGNIGLGSRAVRWDAAGINATELDNIGTDGGGTTNAVANAINSAGTAVGWANKHIGMQAYQRAVRWNAGGTAATELGTNLTDFVRTQALAISDGGAAVGYGDAGDPSQPRPIRWAADGTGTKLLNPAGWSESSTSGQATAINASGVAVGVATKTDENDWGRRAVRWGASNVNGTELATLGVHPTEGYTLSEAFAINTDGLAVGYALSSADPDNPVEHAVYWTADGAAHDLNLLIDANSGWVLNRANSISDTGWITGVGMYDPDGEGGQDAYQRLFLLQLPEPSALGAIALGLCGLLWRRRSLNSAIGNPQSPRTPSS
jgi:hypothetical protein